MKVINHARSNTVSAELLTDANGVTKTITEWAVELGIARQTLWARIHTHGWPVARAVSTRDTRGKPKPGLLT